MTSGRSSCRESRHRRRQVFEVLSGLKAGDEVITGPFTNVRNLRDGDDVSWTRRRSGKTDTEVTQRDSNHRSGPHAL